MSRDYTQIQKLKQEVLSGTTTYADAERRLLEAIRAVEDKADADLDYINTCEDLLLELRTGGEWPSFPTAEKYVAEMQKHMQVKKKNSGLPKFAWRCAAVLAAMFVVVLLGDRLFHWQWFSGISTKDEQQYVIRGHEITIPMIAESIAGNQQNVELCTSNWDEVVAFLGFEPSIPLPQALASVKEDYVVHVNSEEISLTVRYFTENENVCTHYRIFYFLHPEEAFTAIEQTVTGSVVRIGDCEVYVSENLNQNAYTWIDETTVNQLVGNIAVDVGTCIIEDLVGENK